MDLRARHEVTAGGTGRRKENELGARWDNGKAWRVG